MPPHIALSGSYPRKEELVKATWNFDKGLITAGQLRLVEGEATREVLLIQEQNGFGPLTDGLLRWQDTFRPLVATSSSFEVGGVTRLFETNKFYRQPILKKAPKLDWDSLQEFFPHGRYKAKAGWKAILPGPYWFAKATKDEHYADPQKAGDALAGYLNQVARKLDAAGYRQIEFHDPLLFYEAKPDLDWAHELVSTCTKGLKCETILNLPNGNAKPHTAFLERAPVSTIGLDFVETLVEDLPSRPFPKGLLAQVIDSQESLLENPQHVRDLSARIQKRLKPPNLTLTHTWDLEFVPDEVARRKLQILAQAVNERAVTA